MGSSLLACLSVAGVIERSGRLRVLRVCPRFLAHAEATARGLGTALAADAADVLRLALRTWDGYHHDPEQGARFLLRLLEDRDQLGVLRPVFPPIERFLAAA